MALDTAKAQVILNTLTAKFDNTLAAARPFYPTLCQTIPSNRLIETYGMIGNMPGMREWLGDRKFKEQRAARFSIENKHFESSLAIAKNDLADDHMGLYPNNMEQLAIQAADHPDQLFHTGLLLQAESTECFDGQNFYDTDHSWGDSGTQSNKLTYACATGTEPTVAEAKLAYNQALAAIDSYKSDQGFFLNQNVDDYPNSILLMCPRALQQVFVDALYSSTISNSDNNVLVRPVIRASKYLTDATKFYLFSMVPGPRPFIFQAREPLSRQMKGLDDIETKDVKFMTEARYNVGPFAWWTSVLTTLT